MVVRAISSASNRVRSASRMSAIELTEAKIELDSSVNGVPFS
jgi:hypothetical protein